MFIKKNYILDKISCSIFGFYVSKTSFGHQILNLFLDSNWRFPQSIYCGFNPSFDFYLEICYAENLKFHTLDNMLFSSNLSTGHSILMKYVVVSNWKSKSIGENSFQVIGNILHFGVELWQNFAHTKF